MYCPHIFTQLHAFAFSMFILLPYNNVLSWFSQLELDDEQLEADIDAALAHYGVKTKPKQIKPEGEKLPVEVDDELPEEQTEENKKAADVPSKPVPENHSSESESKTQKTAKKGAADKAADVSASADSDESTTGKKPIKKSTTTSASSGSVSSSKKQKKSSPTSSKSSKPRR